MAVTERARIGIVYDPIFVEHINPQGHPERIERLQAITASLGRASFRTSLEDIPATTATREMVERIHTPAYLDELEKWRGREGNLDADTFVSAKSVEAAWKAAGGGIELAERVFSGRLDAGFALLRPPGHHAEPHEAMGFCLINNIAVAAAHLRTQGANRVAIVDWDVHHGNGTQHAFESDGHVLFLSTHQAPFYPGTGRAEEVGRGEGEGFTVNLPFPGGFGDAEYLAAFDMLVVPILEQFKPDIILVSAGFDSHANDPLASMRVTTQGFAGMAARLRSAAERLCEGKIVYFLEGGYDLDGLTQGVMAVLADLVERPPLSQVSRPGAASNWKDVFSRIATVQGRYWKL